MSRQVFLDDELNVSLREDIAASEPQDGEVQVRVVSAGINFWEVMQRRGRVPLPAHRVPGSEGVGVVEKVAEKGVTEIDVGERVAWSKVPGSFSDVVTAPAEAFVRVPVNVSDEVAAALLFQGVTAHYLCEETWPLSAGDFAVVTAAAGGVGVLLTQLLTTRGVRVVGAVSVAQKVEVAKQAGAEHVVTYSEAMADKVRTLVPAGVSAVFDAVGAGVAEPLLPTLRPLGAMVLYGSASGTEAQISAGHLGAGSYFLTRTAGRDYLGGAADVARRSRHLLDLASEGALRPLIGGCYPLNQADHALDQLESRASTGKLLLVP